MAILAVLGVVWGLCPGCNRPFYRRQADRDAYCLVQTESPDPRWTPRDFTIEPDPTSRFYDPNSPDWPPMPPDDPASHELIHCVDGKRGWPYERFYGCTNQVENPAWVLSLLPYSKPKAGSDGRTVVALDREAAVKLALLHSREYQRALENLYLSALDVSLQRFAFDVQFFGNHSTFFTKSGPLSGDAADSSTWRNTSSLEARRLFATGGQLIAEVANSVIWQFSGSDGYTSLTPISLQLAQPLLRGAGRAVVLEELTSSERALLANLRQFERFRHGFYLQVIAGRNPGPGPSPGGLGLGSFSAGGGAGVGGYLSLLEQQLNLRNLRGNVSALRDSLERIDLFYEYGRISRRQVDELLQSLYSSQIDLRSRTTSYYDQLDSYKMTLGLPPSIDVEIQDPMLEPFDLIDPELSDTQDEVSTLLSPVRDVWARIGSAQEAAGAVEDAAQATSAAEAIRSAARAAASAADAADKAIQAIAAAEAGDDAKASQAAGEAAQAAAQAAQAVIDAAQAAVRAAEAIVDAAQKASQSQQAAGPAEQPITPAAVAAKRAAEAASEIAAGASQALAAAAAAKAADLAKTAEAVQAAADAANHAILAAAEAIDAAGGADATLKAADAAGEGATAAADAVAAAAKAVQAAANAVEAALADEEDTIILASGAAVAACTQVGEAAIRVGKAAAIVAELAGAVASTAIQAARNAQARAEPIDQASEVARSVDMSETLRLAVEAADKAADAEEAARQGQSAQAAQAVLQVAVRTIDAAQAATKACQAAQQAATIAADAARAAAIEAAPTVFGEAVRTLWADSKQGKSLPARAREEVAIVDGDLKRLNNKETRQKRIRQLRQLAERPEFQSGEVDPRVADVDAFRRRIVRVNVDFYGNEDPAVVQLASELLQRPSDQDWFQEMAKVEGLAQAIPRTVAELEQSFREGTAEAAAAARDDLAAWRDLLGRFRKLLNDLSGQLLELSLAQARARVDVTTLTPVDLDPGTEQIDLDPAQALEIARANRLDWMNARAALVDVWRQVEVVADRLNGDLNLLFSGNVTTRSDTLGGNNNTTGEVEVGFEFDAPLTRLAERNQYRQVLIAYQRARRDYYAYEDAVSQVLRDALRSIQLNQIQFELRRSSVHTAIDRVEQLRLELLRPPRPEEEEFTLGATTTRDLVSALGSLLNQQDAFLRVWLQYRIQQMNLDFDLGIMELDSRGQWVPSALVGGAQSALGAETEDLAGREQTAPAERPGLHLPPLEELPAIPGEKGRAVPGENNPRNPPEPEPLPDVALRDVPAAYDPDRRLHGPALRPVVYESPSL